MTTSADLLQAAEVGADLLQAYGQVQQTRRFASSASFAGRMQRRQLRQAGQMQAAESAENLREVLGSQRAALGSGGIAGGRTARMFEQEARSQTLRGQQAHSMQRLLRRQQSQLQGQRARSQARMQRLQAGMNLFTSFGGHMQEWQRGAEAQQVVEATRTADQALGG